jgi:hypothetical protein
MIVRVGRQDIVFLREEKNVRNGVIFEENVE